MQVLAKHQARLYFPLGMIAWHEDVSARCQDRLFFVDRVAYHTRIQAREGPLQTAVVEERRI